ncbi:AraC family transcriptional regulator [Sphingobacterium siyangense]|uniref:AraC family transcriptional regulator n=1 Tax=Sphingobacterium siyangense TaxID=459529 RepID=UPI003C751F5D
MGTKFVDLKTVTLMQLSNALGTSLFPVKNNHYLVAEEDAANFSLYLDFYYRSEYYALILIKRGTVEFSVGARKFVASAGDVLFCGPMEAFVIHTISPDMQMKSIYFTQKLIEEAGFNYKTNDILKSFSSTPFYILSKQEKIFFRIDYHITQLGFLNVSRDRIDYSNDMIWHHFSLLMYEVQNFNRYIEQQSHISPRLEAITADFFNLVNEHYVNNHDVQFYADKLAISRKYLTKVLNTTLTKSPKEIINNVLLIEAKVLLKNNKFSVKDVAVKLSFADQATFSKFFKKLTGKNPSCYKVSAEF